MSYTPPSVGPAGLTVPSYNDIINYYVTNFQAIFFGNLAYLANDSADYQLLSLVALSAADAMNAIQLAYNNMSPALAVGGGLSALVALNGLTRKSATNSTCTVTLTGTPAAIITNGIIENGVTGDLWDLPPSVTIGGGGTAVVQATAEQAGAIQALANQLTVIATPTAGWTSVTNGTNVAAVGQPVETDAQLRIRQAISTELPSITLLSGTIAAIAATPGVTRWAVYENQTGTVDANGNPPHSITCVVEGGNTVNVAEAIYANKGIGCDTNGYVNGSPISQTVIVDVTDPNSGVTIPISFIQPPMYVPIYVVVNVHVISGATLTTAQTAAIQNGVANYLNGLQIGELVSFGELVQAAASSVNPDPEAPVISVRSPFYFGTAPSPTTSADVTMLFYQVASGNPANVTVNPV